MISINNLGNFKRARLWINELPMIYCNIFEVMKTKIAVNNRSLWNEKKLCLELYKGPREISNYGLLGIEFCPNSEKFLNVIVNVSSDNEKILLDNIAMSTDEVHIGIPKIYAQKILQTAKETLSLWDNTPCGDLIFKIGAHGLVGSSQLIFSKLTTIILNLMSNEFDDSLIIKAQSEIDSI